MQQVDMALPFLVQIQIVCGAGIWQFAVSLLRYVFICFCGKLCPKTEDSVEKIENGKMWKK